MADDLSTSRGSTSAADPQAPRLICIAGSRKGETLVIPPGETLVGRGPDNGLNIESSFVSRRHCVLQRLGHTVKILDRESSNGVFVNDLPIKERFLQEQDRLSIGDCVFIFSGSSPSPPVRGSTADLDKTSTNLFGRTGAYATPDVEEIDISHWRRGDSGVTPKEILELTPEELSKFPFGVRHEKNDYEVLIKIGSAIASIAEQDVLHRRLLELFFEVAPADRGAILLGEGPGEIGAGYGWDRLDRGGRQPLVEHSVIRRVLEDGIAVLSNSLGESGLDGRDPVRAVLAVPLLAFDKVRGVIYLDSSTKSFRFHEGQLRLFAAVGRLGGAALAAGENLSRLEGENRRLQRQLNRGAEMVGESDAMHRLEELINRVAPTDSTVLISGESGTGKELVARRVHASSKRSDRPFVPINCAVLADALLESELFGHEKGAFTGADALKPGKLEVAHRGTLFLDEVGELALDLQAKLLRVLQEREFQRVGGTKTIKVDVRLLAATNRDLARSVGEGRFRRDLYYRLNVISIPTPSLRDRREDIPLLANYFLTKFCREMQRRIVGISDDARSCLMAHDWPGNVRELSNAIERAVVLCGGTTIELEDLPEALLESPPATGDRKRQYRETINDVKRQLVTQAVRRARGNHTKAAQILGLHPNNLYRLIRTLGLKDKLAETGRPL